jgi:CDP-glucose 4,6-dehydratase
MESMGINMEFWSNKKVLLTGHTGFKGSWLSLWLSRLGAEVHGYALEPETTPNIFSIAGVEHHLASSTIADIRDLSALSEAIETIQPDIIFHLAAQPLVRHSYEAPVETYSTNVMGTVNLFEAVRQSSSVKTVVNVTTDKCYENQEWVWSYREDEAMGGHDPYSSSKGCSELVTAAYRRSFLARAGVGVASARAGNVIGGGDWARDRLIPDFLRAMDENETVVIRSPAAIRPWQHVLEPLSGYLLLAEKLYSEPREYAQAWNFGPSEHDARNVEWIVKRLVSSIPGTAWKHDKSGHPHEAHYLKLDSSKARNHLQWQPRWNLETALEKIIEWHQGWRNGEDMNQLTMQQIADYERMKD